MTQDDATILHLDMDSFFASVEIRDDPALQGLPVVVGGSGPRGVVAAASYPARAFGVRSAMPIGAARRLCPDLVIIPPHGERYRAASREVMELLSSVCAEIEQISIDEAFLDVRGARRRFGTPAQIGRLLRSRIRAELDLPCSVGAAVSRPVAKIASARAKPDGLLVIAPEQTAEFLAPLPVGAVSGIGPAAVAGLERLGIRRIGQIAETPLPSLRRALGVQADQVLRIARGEDRTGIGHSVRDRSVGMERTYDVDLDDPEDVRRRLTIMADTVAASLRRKGLTARTVALKLRAPDGTTITRSATFGQPTASGERLREHVVELWERAAPQMPRVRLAGVRAEHLRSDAEQAAPAELQGRTATWQELEAAMDRAHERFGTGTLTRGSTLPTAPSAVPASEESDAGESPGSSSRSRDEVPPSTGRHYPGETAGERARHDPRPGPDGR